MSAPILPPNPSEFCNAIDEWAVLATEAGTRVNANFSSAWFTVRLAIRKSCLLDRMLYGGEKPSKTPCPVHEGRWSGVSIHPGDVWVGIDGTHVPAKADSVRQQEYDAGCRCFQHRSCRCTTGWLPDEHCGCKPAEA